MNILHIDSSPHRESSESRTLTTELVVSLKKKDPNGTITYRDLDYQPPFYVTGDLQHLADMPEEQRTPEQDAALKYSDAAIAEVLAADILVLEAPMYNLMVSADVKAWLDQIIRLNKTYTANHEGLAAGKKMFVVTSRGGGNYGVGEPIEEANFQDPYLRKAFATIGITDIEFIHVRDREQLEKKTSKWTVNWPSFAPTPTLSYRG